MKVPRDSAHTLESDITLELLKSNRSSIGNRANINYIAGIDERRLVALKTSLRVSQYMQLLIELIKRTILLIISILQGGSLLNMKYAVL